MGLEGREGLSERGQERERIGGEGGLEGRGDLWGERVGDERVLEGR